MTFLSGAHRDISIGRQQRVQQRSALLTGQATTVEVASGLSTL